MDVTFTPAARQFMRRMVRFSGAGEGAGFRLTVTPGGCSGYSAQFSVEAHPPAGDETMDIDGLKVFLPAISRVSLDGVTVDFSENSAESGLTFRHPNAGSCGCSSGNGGGKPAVATVSLGDIARRTVSKDRP